MGGFFLANYVVTTYDSLGYSTKSNRSRSYLINNNKVNGVSFLPTSLDISELLDKEALLSNLAQYAGGDIENKINDWVTVDMEVEFYGYTGKNSDGTYGIANLSNSYKSHQVSSYENATGVDQDISELLADFSYLSFGDSYLGNDIELWGKSYLVSPTVDNYSENMDLYCQNTTAGNSLKTIRRRTKESFSKNKKNLNYSALNIDLSNEIEGGLLVYPNPSNGIFTIDYLPKEKGKIELLIYDENGELLIAHKDYVLSTHLVKKVKINLDNLKSGIYILTIRDDSGKGYAKKLIKN